MQRDELLPRIRAGRAQLDEALARIPDDRMVDGTDDPSWSGKDQLAHLTAWHRVALNRIAGNIPSKNEIEESIDEVNERLFQRDRDLPLEEVRAAFASTFDELVAAIESLGEDDLDRLWFPDHAERGTFAQMIAANTSEHYEEHVPLLRALAAE